MKTLGPLHVLSIVKYPKRWEFGQDEGASKLHIKLVIGPITFIDIERHNYGWCFNVLGFWWIP